MNQFFLPFFSELEFEYQLLNTKPIPLIQKSIEVETFLKNKYKILEKWIEKKEFEDINDEIHFFKDLKPSLVSKIIFHKTIVSIEANLPPARKDKKVFLDKELNKTFKLSKKYHLFYQYYKSNATYNDFDYFVRSQEELYIQDDSILLNFNRKTATSYDYIFAAFIANDLIANYIEKKIEELENNSSVINQQIKVPIYWTGSKIEIIELIYALHHAKMINSGNIEIKDLVLFFNQTFNMNLDDSIYRTYHDIKNRKIDKTKFLNKLTKNLIKFLEEE